MATQQQDVADALNEVARTLANGEDEDYSDEIDYNDLGFIRHGKPDIVLPSNITLGDAAEAIKRREEEMEQGVEFRREFDGVYPADGLVALKRAIAGVFGYASQSRVVQTLFGEQQAAPRQMAVNVGYGETERVFIDRLEPPALEGGYIEPMWKAEDEWPVFALHFSVKAKHRDAVEKLADAVEKRLKTDSIYKGQAVRVNLDYATDDSVRFDLSRHEPDFMDTESDVDPLILNDDTEFSLNTQVLQRIRHPEIVDEMGVDFNHGALLSGPYGTGKTLTAAHIARECVDNDVTFIYVDDVRQLSAAFEFARRYAPAVVFGEDIDAAVGEGEDYKDEVSNAIDDLEAKGEDILTVLTTNHVDDIDAKFLRAGRVDSLIHVGRPNASTVKDFVQQYTERADGSSMLAPGIDLDAVGEVMDGYVPSFISEACERAKMFAQFRAEEEGVEAEVRTEDLVRAGRGLKQHAELARMSDEEDKESAGDRFIREVADVTVRSVKDDIGPELAERTSDRVIDKL